VKFTQELVDFLNQGGIEPDENWFESNPSVLSIVTSTRVIIRPPLFDNAQRVSVMDNQYGRMMTILKRSGERCYIFQITNESLTVEAVEALIHTIEEKGGTCRIEHTFLVIDLPLGYLLDVNDANLISVVQK